MVKSIYFSLALAVLVAAPAHAQYGGGGGTTGGTSSTSGGGYGGSGGKTAAYVAIYAAAGTALYVYLLKRPTKLVGCVGEAGEDLHITTEKDKKTYLLDSPDVTLRPGTRVEIRGRKSKYGAVRKFRVKKLLKELGPCEAPMP